MSFRGNNKGYYGSSISTNSILFNELRMSKIINKMDYSSSESSVKSIESSDVAENVSEDYYAGFHDELYVILD